MARPAVVVLLALFTATGIAEAGSAKRPLLLAAALVPGAAFLLFSVVANDLADEQIDRVNLPGDPARPLVTGICGRREFVAIGITAGTIALLTSSMLRGPAMAIMLAGLALSAAYSLKPLRLAKRGIVASLVLPACYVAVPYLLGVLAVRSTITPTDLTLLGALYVGFIGRILLKDFRDVRGDTLFGKHTFLVRHGRRPTCVVSAMCWIGGSILLSVVRGFTVVLGIALAVELAVELAFVLVLLALLSIDRGARGDEWLVSAIAILGRGTIVVLLAHLSMLDAHWPALAHALVLGSVVTITSAQAWTMLRFGPVSRVVVPLQWTLDEPVSHSPPR
jgi:4-hydroxybenzoate polyprenyltransferase